MDSTTKDTPQTRPDNMPSELFTSKIQEITESKIEEITEVEPVVKPAEPVVKPTELAVPQRSEIKPVPKFGLSLSSEDFDDPEPAPKEEAPKRPKIRIIAGVVTQDRRVSMNTASSLQNAKEYFAKQDIEFKILYLFDRAEHMAKNKLISLFLTTDSTHLLLVGDTLSFTPPILERLLSANKPVICAACPMATRQWHQLVEWSSTHKSVDLGQIPTLLANYFINVSNDKRNRRVLEDDHLFVDFAASDFMFLRRDCVDELVKKFGTITSCVNVSTQNVENIYTLFEPLYVGETSPEAAKTYKNPDETFCSRLQACKFDIIVDTKAHILREISGEIIHGNLNDLISLKQKKQ